MLRIFIILLSLFTAFPVFAEDVATGSMPPTTPNPTVQQELRNAREGASQDIKNIRETFKSDVQNIRNTTKGEMMQFRQTATSTREDLRMEMEKNREEFQNKLEAAREAIKQKVESAKEALKTKLSQIKDERKKATVQKIDDQINELNKNQTDHFSAILNKLDDILTRVSSRADKAAANGKNISVVTSVIVTAKTAIAASRVAVVAQAAKTYPLTITNENALRQDIGKARQALHSDLKAVNDTVITARAAVQKAAQALSAIPGVDQTALPQTSTTTRIQSSESSSGAGGANNQ